MDDARFEILFADRQSTLAIDPAELRRAIVAILSDAEYVEAEISVAIVDDEEIHEINRTYLEHDYPTDVISFPLEDDGERLEGEVVVSTDTAVATASDYDWPALDELLLYVIHGTLHLVGYDDHSPEDKAEMRAREAHYLQQLGRTPPESHA